jgi:hypothetical protein
MDGDLTLSEDQEPVQINGVQTVNIPIPVMTASGLSRPPPTSYSRTGESEGSSMTEVALPEPGEVDGSRF